MASDPDSLAFFILLLMYAAYKPTKIKYRGKVFELQPGQVLLSRPQWEARHGINSSKLYRLLKAYEADGMITFQAIGKLFTLVTIANWAEYQAIIKDSPPKKTEQENEQLSIEDLQGFEGDLKQRNEQGTNTSKPKADYTQIIADYRSRFSPETLELFDKYMDILKTTRRGNKIADSVVCQILEKTLTYNEIIVRYACLTVIKNPALHSKKENYFYGILRNTSIEEAQYKLQMHKGAANNGKSVQPNQPKSNKSGYDTSKIIYNGPTNDFGDGDIDF